jgi:hypothetical protein
MNLKHKNVLKRHFSKKKYTRKIVQKENMQGKGKKKYKSRYKRYPK